MKRIYILLFTLSLTTLTFAQSEWELRLMPQIAFGGRNTIQRPNNAEGTRVALNSEFNRKNAANFSPRFELEYTYKRHHFLGTVALVNDKFDGMSAHDIRYDNELFIAGENIDTKYKFNTYRIGYRYRLVNNTRFALELGATILFRDAYISMQDVNKKAKFSNFGVAPLLSYFIEWKAAERLSLLSYGDAFGIKVGRAEDIFAGAKYQITPRISALAGYRLLEGGSDGDEVYTMAAFHFLSLGVGFKF